MTSFSRVVWQAWMEPVNVGVVQRFALVLNLGHVAFSVARRHDVAKWITQGPENRGAGETSAGWMSPLQVEGDMGRRESDFVFTDQIGFHVR